MYGSRKQNYVPSGSYIVDAIKGTQAFMDEVYKNDQIKKNLKESAERLEREEKEREYNRYIYESGLTSNKRSEYLQKVKTELLSECLLKLFKESFIENMNRRDEVIARNLIVNFVKENGASRLISDFSTKNLLLSEFSRICDKYYDKILECDCKNCDIETDDLGFIVGRPLKLTDDIGMSFYDDLNDIDCTDASNMIRDKVSDTLTDFVDTNMSTKLDYEEVINDAKDQMNTTQNEAQIEYLNNNAKRKIVEMQAMKDKTVFHCIVESLTKAVYKDKALQEKYMTESAKVDMDSVVRSAKLLYTMLEMVNTTNMVNVNEEFIKNYIDSLES